MTTTQGTQRPRTLFCTSRVPGSGPDINNTYQCMNSAFVMEVEATGRIVLQCPMCKTKYNLEALAVENGVPVQEVMKTADDFAAANCITVEKDYQSPVGIDLDDPKYMF